MISTSFFKALSDLGFIYTVCGVFVANDEALFSKLFMLWVLQAAAHTLSYIVREKGALRFITDLAAAAAVFFAGISTSNVVMMLIGSAYLLYLDYKQTYATQRYQAVNIFQVFWKICFAILIIGYILQHKIALMGFCLPVASFSLIVQVIVMRRMRHDESVSNSLKYQLVDMGLVSAAGLGAFIASRKGLIDAILGLIKYFYMSVIVPVLMIMLRVVCGIIAIGFEIVAFIVKLFGGVPKVDPGEVKIQMESAAELLQVDNQVYESPAYIKYIVWTIMALCAFLVLTRIFKLLTPDGAREKTASASITREFIKDPNKAPARNSKDPNDKIRLLYKRFLKLYSKKNLPLKRSSTSLDVERFAQEQFDSDEVMKLRKIYLKARYSLTADEADVDLARSAVDAMSKS